MHRAAAFQQFLEPFEIVLCDVKIPLIHTLSLKANRCEMV
jgi:hypothetical protein